MFQSLNPEAWTDSLNRSAEDTVSGHSVLLTLNCWCDAAARGYCLRCQPLHHRLLHYFINISSSLVSVLKDSNKKVLEFSEICIWKGKAIQNRKQQTMKCWWRREQLSTRVYWENTALCKYAHLHTSTRRLCTKNGLWWLKGNNLQNTMLNPTYK